MSKSKKKKQQRKKASMRRRPSREQVRSNAAKGGQGQSQRFKMPAGIDSWSPEKAASYNFDILPYEVTDENHPDGVEKGMLWYKRPFAVHHGVGINDDSIVCPASVGKPCPICAKRAALSKADYDGNADQIKAMKPQKYVAFNMQHPDDVDKFVVLALSRGKFAQPLEQELLEASDDAVLNFWDVTDEGKTLKVRFSKDTFNGRDFLVATRIDFKDRDAMDEDEILEAVANLDDIFYVLPADKIEKMFFEIEDEDEDEDKKKGKKGKKGKGKKKPEPEEEEDDEEPAPKKGKGKKDKKKSKKGKCPKGHKFGKDVDKFDDCDDCNVWDACEEANDA